MGIEFIEFLQKANAPWFVEFVKALNWLDTGEFYFALIPLTWMALGWKKGLKIFYIFLINLFVNQGLKLFFAEPRPFMVDPAVGIIHVQGLAFPSGAAQGSFLIAGILIANWKSRWRWLVGISYCLLVSFSRVYLGVHYPIDILGGWFVGFLLLMVYIHIFPMFNYSRKKVYLGLVFLIVLLFTLQTQSLMMFTAAGIGIQGGLLIAEHFKLHPKTKRSTGERAIDVAIAVSGAFIVYGALITLFGTESRPLVIFQLILTGAWVSLGAPALSRLIPGGKA